MKRSLIFILAGALILFVFTQCESGAIKDARSLLQAGETDQAIEKLTLALEAKPDDADAHYMLATIYLTKREYVKMCEHFDKSLAISGKHLVEVELTRMQAFNECLNSSIELVNSAFDETEEEKTNEMLHQSIDMLNNALAISDDPRPYGILGTVYLNLQDFENAEKNMLKALEADSTNKNVLHQLGILKYNNAIMNDNDQELFKEAIYYFEKYLLHYPEERANLEVLGSAYEQTSQEDKAIAYYDQLLTDNPNRINARLQLGVLKYNKGDIEGASVEFNKALELEPENITALKNVTVPIWNDLQKKLGDKTDTEDDWKVILPYLEKITQLDKTDADYWEYLAIAYIKLGDKDKSDEAMKKADNLRKYK